jgi:hypothetical protein
MLLGPEPNNVELAHNFSHTTSVDSSAATSSMNNTQGMRLTRMMSKKNFLFNASRTSPIVQEMNIPSLPPYASQTLPQLTIKPSLPNKGAAVLRAELQHRLYHMKAAEKARGNEARYEKMRLEKDNNE